MLLCSISSILIQPTFRQSNNAMTHPPVWVDTNSSPLRIDTWKTAFLLGRLGLLLGGELLFSFREGRRLRRPYACGFDVCSWNWERCLWCGNVEMAGHPSPQEKIWKNVDANNSCTTNCCRLSHIPSGQQVRELQVCAERQAEEIVVLLVVCTTNNGEDCHCLLNINKQICFKLGWNCETQQLVLLVV